MSAEKYLLTGATKSDARDNRNALTPKWMPRLENYFPFWETFPFCWQTERDFFLLTMNLTQPTIAVTIVTIDAMKPISSVIK